MYKYTIVGVVSKLESIPYLWKLSTVLEGLGSTSYIFWDRDKNSKNSFSFFKFSPKGKVSLLIGYIFWFLKLNYFFCFKANTGTIYFVSRLDAALPVLIAKIFGRKLNYIYLDRDAYFMTYRLGLFKQPMKWLERCIGKNSLKHFVPGVSRDFTKLSNVEIIPNTPASNTINKARVLSRKLERNCKFTIYINGWLVETRGAQMILATIKMLSPESFRVLVAGNLECPAIKELVNMPCVEYLGCLTVEESLSYYYIADVVLAFYDPSIEINRNAEPNKWYDCLFIGVPFITNNGINTISHLDSRFFYLVDYNDSEQLIDLLNKLSCRSECSMHDFENNFEPWDVKVKEIVSLL